jgi:hypothetical protein
LKLLVGNTLRAVGEVATRRHFMNEHIEYR